MMSSKLYILELQAQQSKYDVLINQNQYNDSQLGELRQRIVTLQNVQRSLSQDLQNARHETEEKDQELCKVWTEVDKLATKLQHSQNELAVLKQNPDLEKFQELENDVKTKEGQVTKMQEDIAKLNEYKARVPTLEQDIQ